MPGTARNKHKLLHYPCYPTMHPDDSRTVTKRDGEGKVTSEKQNQTSLRVSSKPRMLLATQHRQLAAGSVAGKLQLIKAFQKQSAVFTALPKPLPVTLMQTLLYWQC